MFPWLQGMDAMARWFGFKKLGKKSGRATGRIWKSGSRDFEL
jgi:hypothetical protein